MQAVVLDVVDDLQQGEGHHRLAEEEDRSQPAEGQAEAEQEEGADGVPPDQLVAPVQGRQALALQALGLQAPGVEEVVLVGVREERVEALAVARGRGIFRGRDVYMVAAHVFDLEAGIAHRRQQQAAGVLFQLRVLVDQFVGDGDADGAHHGAHRQDPAQLADPVPAGLVGEDPAGPDEHAQQQRDGGQGQYAVVALCFHLRHFAGFLGVGRIAADDGIEDRDQPEHHADHQPGPGVGVVATERPPVAERDAEHRDQPDPVAVLFQTQHPGRGKRGKHGKSSYLSC